MVPSIKTPLWWYYLFLGEVFKLNKWVRKKPSKEKKKIYARHEELLRAKNVLMEIKSLKETEKVYTKKREM